MAGDQEAVASLSQLLFMRGVFLDHQEFSLATQVVQAKLFNDIVFSPSKGSYKLIKVKHCTTEKIITFKDIFESENEAFNLLKHIRCYKEIIQGEENPFKSAECLLFTNAHLDTNDIKLQELQLKEQQLFRNDVLYLKNVAPDVKYYKFKTKKVADMVLPLLKNDKIDEDTIAEALDKIMYAVSQPREETIFTTIRSEMEERLKLFDSELFEILKEKIDLWAFGASVFKDPTITYAMAKKEIEGPAKLIYFEVIPPVETFEARQVEQNKIDKILNESTNSVIISGINGIGKTELVKKYIKEYRDEKNYNRVVWINATSNETIRESFKRLAGKVGIVNLNDIKELMVNVIKYFVDTMILFVFDNVELEMGEKIDYVRYFLDTIEVFQTRTHVIIITKNSKYKSIPILVIEALTLKDTVKIIQNQLKEIHTKDAEELVEMLLYNLGAIQQAITFIEIETVNVFKDLMKSGLIQANPTEKSFTVLLALELIKKKDSVTKNSAIKILNVLAYLYAKKIPVRLLRESDTDIEREMIESALDLLERLFLITFDSSSKEMVSILPIVQSIIRKDVVKYKREKETLFDVLKTLERFIASDEIEENLKKQQIENVMFYALDCQEIVTENYNRNFHHNKKMIHYAAQIGNLKAIETIYAKKGDLSVQDGTNKTPLQIALERGMIEVLSFLLTRVNQDLQKEENKEALYSLFAGEQLKFIQFLLIDDSIATSDRDFLVGLLNINKNRVEDVQLVVTDDLGNKQFKHNYLEGKLIELFKNKRKDYKVMPYLRMIFSGQEKKFIEEITEKKDPLLDDNFFVELLKFTLLNGCVMALNFLLENRKADLNSKVCPVLVIAVKLDYCIEWSIREQYYSCIDLILNNPTIEINACDLEGNTPLHVTKDQKILHKLFSKNISIAYPNKKGEYPFENVTAERFDAEINSLVTTYLPSYIMNDPKIYELLVLKEKLCLGNFIFIDYRKLDPLIENSSIIWFIKKLNEEEHLSEKLNHCVIVTVLNLFWKSARNSIVVDRLFIFIMMLLTIFQLLSFSRIKNQTFQIIYFIIIIIIALLHYLVSMFRSIFKCWNSNTTEENEPTNQCDKFISIPMVSMEISENIQNQNQRSLACFEYWNFSKESMHGIRVKILDIIFLALVIFHNGLAIFKDPPVGFLVGASIVLSIELSLIGAYLIRKVAINIIMLYTVLTSSFLVLLSNIFLLLGFSYGLMTYIPNFNKFASQFKTENENASITEIGRAFTATLIMTIGELDAKNLYFDHYATYVIFVLFIFSFSIVFINLLNGLALYDVQKIQQNAENEYWKFKLEILCDMARFYGFEKLNDFVTIGIDKTSLKMYSFEMDQHGLTGIKFIDTVKKSSLNKLLEIIIENNNTKELEN